MLAVADAPASRSSSWRTRRPPTRRPLGVTPSRRCARAATSRRAVWPAATAARARPRDSRDPARVREGRARARAHGRCAPAAGGGGRGPPRRSARARRADAPLRRRRRSRRAGAADRRELRRLERRQGRPQPPGRSDRDRDRRPPGRQLEGRQRRACATPSAPTRARRPRTSTGATCCSRSTTAPTPRPRSRTCSRSTRTTPTRTSAWRASRSPTATTARRRSRSCARALAVNPAHAGALALRAALALDAENWAGAAADVAAIRRTNPRDLGAARVAAAAALLLDDRAGYERERARAIWPSRPNDGDFFAFVAEALTHHRRYDDARAVANEGVAADPDDAGCLAALAMTLLRLGDETAGLDALRRAWKRDPYDVRTYNLLNLYEKVIPARYTTVDARPPALSGSDRQPRRDHRGRRARTSRSATAISSPATASSRPAPVILELYGDPHEFAVRTTGLPAHRRRGRLLRPRHHVAGAHQPRLQLGHGADARAGARVRDPAVALARAALVHRGAVGAGDDARLRPEWTRHDDAALYAALRTRRACRRWRRCRTRSSTARGDEAARAYAHAAVAVDFLERRFGFPALREALEAFGRGESEAAVLEKMTGLPRGRAGTRVPRRARRGASRATTSSICRRSPSGPPPRRRAAQGVAARPRTGPRAASARCAPAISTRRRKALERARARAAAVAPTSRRTRCSSRARSRSRARRRRRRGGVRGPARRRRAAARRLRGARAARRWRRSIASAPPPPRPTCAAPSSWIRRASSRTRCSPSSTRASSGPPDRLAELEAALRLDPQTDASPRRSCWARRRPADRRASSSWRRSRSSSIRRTPDLHAALGRALAATGKAAAGAAALERALALRPAVPCPAAPRARHRLRHARRPQPGRRPPRRRRRRRRADRRRSASPIGNVSVNVVPAPGGLATSIWPP